MAHADIRPHPDIMPDDSVHYDLKFTDASTFSDAITPDALQDASLKQLCHTFRSNVERIRAMAFVPMSVADGSTRHMLMFSQSVHDALAKPVLADADLERLNDVFGKYKELVERQDFFRDKERAITKCIEFVLIYNQFNENVSALRPGFLALLGAQIIRTWTAFDSLTTDLWVTAVNLRPNATCPVVTKAIPTVKLQKYGYNLRGHMGDLLKDEYHFDSFKNTRAAYTETFRSMNNVQAILSSRELAVACLVRNNLVHNAGIVSESFVNQVSEFARWRSARIDTLVPLDGRNVADTTSEIVRGGISCFWRLTLGFVKRLDKAHVPNWSKWHR